MWTLDHFIDLLALEQRVYIYIVCVFFEKEAKCRFKVEERKAVEFGILL